MAVITSYIYIAAVLAITLISLRGANGTCKDDSFKMVGDQCYRINYDKRTLNEARNTCVLNDGKLAQFTSIYHQREVLTALGVTQDFNIWVDGPSEAEENLFWTSVHSMLEDAFYVFKSSCYLYHYASICTENNNEPVNDSTSKTKTNATTQDDLTSKERNALTTTIKNNTCLYNDSVNVDGLCFRLSTDSFTSANASIYCNSWNGTLATISSVGQAIKVLTAMKISGKSVWITDSLNSERGWYTGFYEGFECNEYRYGITKLEDKELEVLCLEMISTKTQKLTDEPGSITANESITATPGEEKLVNRNQPQLLMNPLLKLIYFKTRIEYYTRFGYYTNDVN